MIRKRKTVVAKRITPKVMTGIPKLFGILNDPLGNQVESSLMEKEEAEQRKTDRFWGQDKDFKDREHERSLMLTEDAASFANEKWFETVALHKKWDEEYQRNLWFENRSQAKYKEIERREYLKFVNSSLSSDEVINFVWKGSSRASGTSLHDGGSALNVVGGPQQGGLVFSDISAIGKEVSLSLPSAVGALHMSVHLDGLQQSKAIIDGASVAFKKTLRRINTQSAEDGDASQPFKTNTLAAEIIRNKKKQQQQSGELVGSAAVPGIAEEALEPAKPLPCPAVEGHPLHKWDQDLMLHLAFMALDKGGKGFLTPEEVAAVSFDSKAHALLSFTVFWANIKKRNWGFFQNMAAAAGLPALVHPSPLFSHSHSLLQQSVVSQSQLQSPYPGHQRQHMLAPSVSASASSASVAGDGNGSNNGISMREWMVAAHSLSFESCVPLRHIRTQEEHVQICSTVRSGGIIISSGSRGVGAANVFSGLPEREHRLARSLSEGDCVWALHNGGVLWLPAVVKAIHSVQPQQQHKNNIFNSHGSTVAYSTYSYDLWYPISQKDLHKARSAMTSRQLLALPSQQQQLQLAQDRLQSLSLLGSPQSSSSVAAAAASKCLVPKPLEDERKVCAYAFDLVDSSGEGVVALHRLVQCLQSVEFSRVVSTSLALSTIFHGGSYATSSNSNSNDVPSQAAGTGTGGQPMAQARGEEDKKEKVKETEGRTELKGSSKGVRAVSSVSVAGTVADIPSLLPVFIDTFSAPAPPEEPNPDPGEPQQQGQQAQAQDWISKLDFLEFCQAVVDIKRYSVGGC